MINSDTHLKKKEEVRDVLRATEFDVNAQLAESGGRIGEVWGGDLILICCFTSLTSDRRRSRNTIRDKRVGRKSTL